MINVLYVGGLSDTTSDHQLRDLLGPYGTVSRAYVVKHKYSGNSDGYGFVEMGSSEQAVSAVIALEDAVFEGKCLRLYIAPHA